MDSAALAEQYADASNLDARIQLHETYDTADREWWPWVFDHYEELPSDADILEVGCGTGYLWRDSADRIPPEWSLLLTDFSDGMVAEARETLSAAGVDASFEVAAAESLPYSTDSFDAVIANHMLYHVDREQALPELRRVLRPGGRLYATTNGESNMVELYDMLRETTTYEPESVANFSLESGFDQLSDHFETVRRHERDTSLRVPDVEPLVAYAASLPGVDADQVEAFAELAEERFDGDAFEIQKSMGLFICETH